MELEFRKNFDKVRKNWQLMWAGKLNRPILLMTVPKPNMTIPRKPKWGAAVSTPAEELCDQVLRWAEAHEFMGDAVPSYTPSLIIGIYEALMGAEVKLVQESWGMDSKVVPCIDDLNSFEGRLHKESEWWEKWVSLVETMKRKLAGKIVFGEGFPGSNLDQLSSLRGPENFMMDFYDNPEGVHNAMREMQKVFDEFHRENTKLMEYDKYGSATRHGFYSDGIAGVPQSDAAFSIGKEHFDEFALPHLKREISRLDAVEYHLDGTGNLTHLDSICDVNKIAVVQWVPGTGNEGRDWSELYQEISSRGKGLFLGTATPESAAELWERYGESGRMVLSCYVKTKAEAENFLKKFSW